MPTPRDVIAERAALPGPRGAVRASRAGMDETPSDDAREEALARDVLERAVRARARGPRPLSFVSSETFRPVPDPPVPSPSLIPDPSVPAPPLPASSSSGRSPPSSRACASTSRRPSSTPRLPPDASAVTFEDVVRTPHWSSLNPGAFEFSPDDTAIANLVYDREDRSDSNLKLCVYDIATGAQKLACGAPGGFCRYEWARAGFGGEGGGSSGGARLMTHRGEADSCEVHVRDYADGEFGPARCVARRITPDGDPVLDPALSPDGRFVSFVRGSEVYVAPCDAPPSADGAGDGEPLWPLHPTRVTHGAHGRPMVTHGLAEYTAVEELGRDRGVWWRPDGGALAFTRADAGDVSLFEMRGPRSSAASLVEGALERHAYPFPGCRNARVTLGVVDVSGLADGTSSRGPSTRSPRSPAGESRDPERATRSPVARVGSRASNRRSFATSSPTDRFPTTWMDVDCGGGDASARGDAEEYLCAVRWTPDGKHLLVQIQNRSQDALRLVKLDAATGDRVGPDPLILERRGPRRLPPTRG